VPNPYETIKIKKEQTTTWITLDRPHKLNAINATMLEELSEALKYAKNAINSVTQSSLESGLKKKRIFLLCSSRQKKLKKE